MNKRLIGELKKYKKDAIKAAKNLFYGEEVIDKIKNAKTVGEVERIMIDARRNEK